MIRGVVAGVYPGPRLLTRAEEMASHDAKRVALQRVVDDRGEAHRHDGRCNVHCYAHPEAHRPDGSGAYADPCERPTAGELLSAHLALAP